MKTIGFSFLFFLMSLIVIHTNPSYAQKWIYPYQNPDLPAEQRVEDLLSRMTLDEKINQLSMKRIRKLEDVM